MSGSIEIALPEMERDLVKRTLLPLFGFREPENPTLGIKYTHARGKNIPGGEFQRACS